MARIRKRDRRSRQNHGYMQHHSARTRMCAAGTAALLAVGVCTVAPASAATAGIAANAANSAGGGRTTLADDSTCTTKAPGIAEAPEQSAVPWEIESASIPAGATGGGVTVAVIDSGITAGNKQLSSTIAGGQDFTGGGNYRTDSDGHGTMVSSIIAAQPSTKNGMTGIAPGVKLLVYREAGCNVTGGNDESTLAQAINKAVDQGAQIINISQAGYTANSALKAAVLNAYQRNVLIVAAAGNYGNSDATEQNSDYGINPVTYPAAYAPYLLAVGAATTDGNAAEFSETGPYVGVIAPGVAVGGLFPDGHVWNDDGTSFAAPYVAGVAALLLQKHPTLSVGTLIRVLESTTSTGNGKWSSSAGWGMVDPVAALSADPDHLTELFGAGPNADGPAAAKPVNRGTSMSPVVNAADSKTVVDQRKGAYLALGLAVLIVLVGLAGTYIARDARRRRLPS